MLIEIVYPKKISYLTVKSRTKQFLSDKDYNSKNSVFVNEDTGNVYIVNKRKVDIILNTDSTKYINQVCEYIKHTFKDAIIGLSIPNKKYYELFSSVNYVKI